MRPICMRSLPFSTSSCMPNVSTVVKVEARYHYYSNDIIV